MSDSQKSDQDIQRQWKLDQCFEAIAKSQKTRQERVAQASHLRVVK